MDGWMDIVLYTYVVMITMHVASGVSKRKIQKSERTTQHGKVDDDDGDDGDDDGGDDGGGGGDDDGADDSFDTVIDVR
jgi:hypothetical protein